MDITFLQSSTRTRFLHILKKAWEQYPKQEKKRKTVISYRNVHRIPPGLLRYANASAPMSSLRTHALVLPWHQPGMTGAATANEVKADRTRFEFHGNSVEHRFPSLGEWKGIWHEGLPAPDLWRKGRTLLAHNLHVVLPLLQFSCV